MPEHHRERASEYRPAIGAGHMEKRAGKNGKNAFFGAFLGAKCAVTARSMDWIRMSEETEQIIILCR